MAFRTKTLPQTFLLLLWMLLPSLQLQAVSAQSKAYCRTKHLCSSIDDTANCVATFACRVSSLTLECTSITGGNSCWDLSTESNCSNYYDCEWVPAEDEEPPAEDPDDTSASSFNQGPDFKSVAALGSLVVVVALCVY